VALIENQPCAEARITQVPLLGIDLQTPTFASP
jgi:hypothetical protein